MEEELIWHNNPTDTKLIGRILLLIPLLFPIFLFFSFISNDGGFFLLIGIFIIAIIEILCLSRAYIIRPVKLAILSSGLLLRDRFGGQKVVLWSEIEYLMFYPGKSTYMGSREGMTILQHSNQVSLIYFSYEIGLKIVENYRRMTGTEIEHYAMN